jgi:hypothetical protein
MRSDHRRAFYILRTRASLAAALAAMLLLGTCDLFKSGLGEKVDITPPTISITSPSQNAYVHGTLTVSGSTADDRAVASLTLRYTGVSGVVSRDLPLNGGAWSVDIATGAGGADNLPDGEQPVTVTATDASGKTSEASLIVYVDNIAPTVLVTVPQGYGLSKPVVNNYIDIKGEAWDRSPIEQVHVSLWDATGATMLVAPKLANGTNTWSVRFEEVGTLPDASVNSYKIEVQDKAGNISTAYYHTMDIWTLLSSQIPPVSIFPATDDIGKLDQTRTGTAGNISYSSLSAYRLENSGTVHGDFTRNADATRPVVSFSNIDAGGPITSNVIGNKVPIIGNVIPGPAGIPVNGNSLQAWIIPWSATPSWPGSPNVDAADVAWTTISTSISFQVKPKVSGAYIPSGHYMVKVEAASVGSTSTGLLVCSFLVDAGAPQIAEVQPADLSLITRKTPFTTGPLAGQDGIEIRVHLLDDNGAELTPVTGAIASLTEGGAALPGLAWAGTPGPDTWYVVQVPLTAGESDIWFVLEAKDDANTITRRTFHYTIDEVPPAVSISSPGPGWVTGDSTTVSGTSSDNSGQVKTVYVWLGLAAPPADFTTWNAVTGNASWATTLPLGGEGAYTIHAVAVDFADNPSPEATRGFFLDQSNPTLTETSIGPVPAYRGTLFTLSGNAGDTNALANITITQKKDGGTTTTVLNQALSGTAAAWSWTLPGGSLDGTYEYAITLTDIAGKTAPTLSRTVIFDTVKPTISVTSLAPVIATNTVNGVVTLQAAVSDASGLDKVWYRYGGLIGDATGYTEIIANKTTPTLTIDTTVSATFPDLTVTDVFLRASDLAGNVQTVAQALDVNQSSDDPVVSLTNMVAGAPAASNLQETNAKVTGNITDDDSVDASTVQISINGGPYVDVSQRGPDGKSVSFEHNLNSLLEGVHSFSLSAYDLASAKAGKPAVQKVLGPVSFAIDRNPPSLAVTSPAPGSLHKTGFTVTGTAGDANGLASVTIKIGAAAPVAVTNTGANYSTWSCAVDVPALSEGATSFTVEAIDTFGKTTTVAQAFTVDRTAPSIVISAPLAGVWRTGVTLTASGTATDASAVALVEWSTDLDPTWNAATGANNWSTVINLLTLGEGMRTLYVRATDAAGNTSAAPATRSFGNDQAAPIVTVDNIGAGVVGKKAAFSLDGTASDTNALAGILVEQKKDLGAYVTVLTQGLAGTNQSWSAATLPRDPSSPATPLLADGIYEYRVTLTDVAGRTDTLYRTVQIDTTPPVVVISNPAAAPFAWLSGTGFTASGTVTDPNSGVALVEWSTDGATWQPASGGSIWSVTLDLTLLGEGQKTLWIRATDNATNMSAPASRNFGIDQNPPNLMETGIGVSQTSRRANFTLGGTADDTVSLMTWDHDSNTGTAEVPYIEVSVNSGAAQKITVAAGAWSLPVTVDPGHANDGQYEYVITATDLSGKIRSVTRTVIVDSTPPALAVEGVTSGLNIALNQVNGVITFKFSADGGLVPVEKSGPDYAAYYTVVPSGNLVDTTAAGMALWTRITSPVSQFTFTSDTTTWGAAGAYDLYVGARDSVPVTPNVGWSKSTIAMDQASDRPLITFTNITAGAVVPQTNPLGRNARLTGNVEDDDGVGPTGIQINIDTTGWVPVSAPPALIGTLVAWSHDLGALAEGMHTLKVRSRDRTTASDAVYGNAALYSWSESADTAFYIDFGPPLLSITGPANGVIATSDFFITGTASDSSGVATVKISIDGALGVPVSSSDGFAHWTYAYTVSGNDGVHTYQVKAIDVSGAETTLDRQFVVDTIRPTSTIDTPQPDQTTNGMLSVSGTASDNYQLANVYYWIGTQGASAPSFPDAAWTALNQTYSWQFNLDTVAKGDGSYTLHVRSLDTGGNVQSVVTTRNFVIDRASDRPVVSISTLNPAGAYADNLLPNTLQVAGMVSDDDAVDGSKIQVAVDNDGNGTFDPPGVMNWTTVSPAVSNGRVVTWSNTFTGLANGQYELFVRAADINDAGLWGLYSSASIGPVRFSVDTAAPTGSVTYPSQGAYLNASSFNITGTAADASGIKSVMIKIGAASPVAVTNTGTNYSTWSYAYTYVADGQVSYQVIVTDAFDKITTVDRYFTMDRTAPTVSFIQPGIGSTVNGSLLVRGEANDNYQVSQIYFAIAQTAPVFPGGYSLLSGTYNWQKRVKTTSYTNGSYTLYVVSVDAAGNNNSATPQTLAVTIDSTTNLPIVNLTTADGTLFDNSGTVTGTISDDDGVDASTIQIDLGDGAGWVAVTSHGVSGSTVSFIHSVAGLAERTASYSVQVRASDIGENFDGGDFLGPDDIPPVTRTSAAITIKKDNGAPTASITSLNNGLLTVFTLQGVYLKNQLTLTGTSTDGVQVAAVEARLLALGTEPFETVTNTETNFSKWTWSKTGLALSGSSVNLEMRVTDYHARVTTYAYTLLVDTTAPTVSIDTQASNPNTATGAYNGSVTFRGSAADGVKVEKVYYRFGTSAAAQPNGTYTGWTEAGSTYSWTTAALDTTTVEAGAYNDAIDHAYHLGAVSVDSAGNESTVQDLQFTINQGSDRPIIALTNVDMTGTAAANRFDANPKIIGTAQDDDGVEATKILVSLDGAPYAAVTNPPAGNGSPGGIVTFSHELTDLTGTIDASTTTSLTDNALIGKNQVVAGSWIVTLSDGSRRTVSAFNSGSGTVSWVTALTAPTGAYTVSLKEGAHTVSLRVGDTGPVPYVEGSFDRALTFRWEQSDGNAAAGWQNAPTNIAYDTGAPVVALTGLTMSDRYAGLYGPGRTLNITTESAMPSTVVDNDWTLAGTIDDGSAVTATVQMDTGAQAPLTIVGGAFTTTFDWLDGSTGIALVSQGSHTINIRATDAYGKVTLKSLAVDFDSNAPVVTMGSPSSMTVNGTVFMSGTFDTAATVLFAAGNGFDKQTSANATSQVSWSYSFNSTLLRNVTDGTYVTGDTHNFGVEDADEIWVYTSKVRLRATDAAGNVAEQIYIFTIDNNTDRPTVTISQPADGSYRAGQVLVSGVSGDDAQADDGVAAVYVRVDANGDGNFADNPAFGPDTHLTGTVASSTALSLTDGGLVGAPVVAGRWVIRFTGPAGSPWIGESRVVSSFSVTTVSWAANPNYYGSSVLAAPAVGTTFVLEELYKNEATWIPVDALTNGVAWQVDINKLGELYASATGHSGMIKIQAKAVDRHKTDGVPSAALTLFLDASIPSVGSISVNASVYTPGLATLSRGFVPITARFADDQNLDWPTRVSASYNGGTAASFQAGELYDWSAGAGKVLLLRSNNAAVSTGTASATTTTSLTAAVLSGRADLVGKAIYVGSTGSRIITAFDDVTDTVSWTGALGSLTPTETFAVTDPFQVNTATYYPGTSGTLSVVLRVTDRTNQSSTATIELSVDNQAPTVAFNDPPQLSPVNGIYSFNGTAAEELGNPTGTWRYRVYGKAVDSGAVSGVASVSVFFVKNITGTYWVYAPQGIVRANQLVSGQLYVILFGGTTNFLALGSSSNAAGTQFTASGAGSGTGLVMARTPVITKKSLGGSAPTSVPSPDTVNAGSFTPGVRYRIASIGTTSFTAIGAASNTVGAYFIATGVGAGSGTALLEYAIVIDKRTELGSNDDNENGDQDGFQESLRGKSGYDEWYADFNARLFDDGPLTVHFVARDDAGNSVNSTVTGQIVNNPPGIGALTFNGSAPPANLMVKYGGTVTFVMYASDVGTGADIDAATYKLTVTNKYANVSSAPGAEDGSFIPFYYGVNAGGSWVRDFEVTKTGGASGSAPLSINTVTDGFVTGNWYRCLSEVKDADGNVAYKIFYLLVNNADTNRPVIKTSALVADNFDDFTQSNLVAGHIEDAGTVQFPATASAVTNGTTFTAAALANNPFIRAGWTVTDTTLGQTRTIQTFTIGTGAIVVTSAFSPAPGIGDTLSVRNPALLSGRVKLTGKAYDDTDVNTVTVRISTDGGSIFTDLGTATKSNQTGDIVAGFTYDWSYEWDTQAVSGVALGNVIFGVYASDAVGYGTLATKNTDIVPYITSITDSTGLSTDVLRGSNGRYSIASHATNTLTVNGYNLSATGLVKISAAANNWTSGTPLSFAPSGGSSIQVTVSKNLTKSGYLTIVVNGLSSPNNVNDNTYARNIETGADPRTAQWRDDRYLWVWGVTPVVITTLNGAADTTQRTFTFPDMVMNGPQPEFSFVDENKGFVDYTTSNSAAIKRTGFRVNRFASLAAATISTFRERFILTAYDTTYGATGNSTGFLEVTGFGDLGATNNMTSPFSPSVDPADGAVHWMTIQGNDYYDGTNTNAFRVTNRYGFPKLLAEPSSIAASANIYVAYYDSSTALATFRNLNFVSFRMNGGTGTAPNWTGSPQSNLTVAANDYSRSTNVISIPGTANGSSSQYLDMVKMGTNGIAIAYYDAAAANLKLAYSINAFNTTGAAGTDNLTNTGPVHETSTLTLTSGTRADYAANGGKYFTIYSGATGYDIWYDTTGSATKPVGAVAPNNIRVNISAVAQTTSAICDATINAIHANAAFTFTAPGNGQASQTIVATATTNATDTNQQNMNTGTPVGTAAVALQGGGAAASAWSTIIVDSTPNAGQYVSMVTDGTKLYLAYYDFDGADLKYARVSWNSGAPSVDGTAHIDNYLSAGTWTKIALITDTNLTGQATAQPFISYYSDSYNGTKKPIRIAFPKFDATVGAISHGTTGSGNDDNYSGSWEVISIPAISVPKGGSDTFQHTQLGVYTNSISLPVVGWVGDNPEYAKLQPNN